MTDNLTPENPDEILNYTLNDDWLLLWYKALLLSDDYRDYCKAVKCINETEAARLIGEYENITKTYDYWGDIYTVDDEIVDFENSDDMYWDGWREDNSSRVNQHTVNKAEIIQEGFSLEPQAGTLYFCKFSTTKHKPRIQTKSEVERELKNKEMQDADPELKKKAKEKEEEEQKLPSELEFKLQGYLDEAVKIIEKKLAKDRTLFTKKPISQLNPDIKSNQLDPTGRRLAAAHELSKQKEISEHYVRDAFIELLKYPPTRSWEVKRDNYLKQIKENDAYPDSIDELTVSYLGDDYANFKTEERTGLQLIKNATNFIFPKC